MKNKLLILTSKITFKLYSLWKKNLNKLILVKLQTALKSLGCGAIIEYPIITLGLENISIGNNFISRKNLKLRAFTSFNDQNFTPHIEIGNNVFIETDCHIACINHIKIGNNVLIASRVYISDHVHGVLDYSDIETPPIKRILISKGPVIIEDNVWVGEGAVILANVKVGRCSIVGANAVVTKDVPPYTVVAGIPAKVIKKILLK